MRQNILNLISYATIVLAGATVLLVLYWLIFPLKWVEVVEPLHVLNPRSEVSRGEELVYEIKYKKYKEISTRSNRTIECGDNLVTLTEVSANSTLPAGEYTYIDKITVPEKSSLGECVLAVTVTYELNPIREPIIRYESEIFKIVE